MGSPFKRRGPGSVQQYGNSAMTGIKDFGLDDGGENAPAGSFDRDFDDDFGYSDGDFGMARDDEPSPAAHARGSFRGRNSGSAQKHDIEEFSDYPADGDGHSPDVPESSAPASAKSSFGFTRPAEIVSVDGSGSVFGQLKTKLAGILNSREQDDGVEYYTPPDGYAPQRERYKRINFRPVPMWIRSVLLAAAMLFAIFVLVKLVFFSMMLSRVNYIDAGTHAPVRLTLDESAAMQAQLSEETVNDVTLPSIAVRTNDKIRLILLVGTSELVGSGNAGECDSMVLIAVDREHDRIKLVSIARELYTQIPDYRNNMMGEAYFYDSASGCKSLDVLRKVVENTLCIKIDNIVAVDYDALQIIVNKLGGITVTITDEEAQYMSSDPKYGNFPRYTAGGIYTMTGAEMLNYLRMVNIGEKTDAERTARLRSVLGVVKTGLGELSGVKRYAAMYSVLPYITTDMTQKQMYDLVTSAKKYSGYDLCGYSLPVSGSWGYDNVDINGERTKVIVANYSFNAEYLQKFIYDDDLTYTYGNSVSGVDVPYISEEAKAAAAEPAE